MGDNLKSSAPPVLRDKPKQDIEKIRQELENCQKKSEEYLAGWKLARADFLNYKKEEMERIGELLKYAGEEFILKILPILDNFDLAARQNLPENLSEQEKNKEIISGFLQIRKQLQDFLKNQGVEEMKSIGEKFDPKFHEVVEEVPASAEASARQGKDDGKIESGVIIEEVQKGYKINGRLLRPAKVRVAK